MRGFKRILFLSSFEPILPSLEENFRWKDYYSCSSVKFRPGQQRTGLKLNYASLNIDRVEHFV